MGRKWVLGAVSVLVVAGLTPEAPTPSPQFHQGPASAPPAPIEVDGPAAPTASRPAARRRSCFTHSNRPARLRAPGRRPEPSWAEDLRGLLGGRGLGVAVGFGERIAFAHDAVAPRTPASNQKLLLSMVLLDVFGPDGRIPTILRIQRDGGDLYVVGRGDPTFGDSSYRAALGLRGSSVDALVRVLAGSGLARIRGNVIAVGSHLARDWDAPGWQPYVRQTYVTRPTALSFNANATTEAPEMQVATGLGEALENAGIEVAGDPRLARVPKGRTIARVWSPPVRELIAIMNRDSSNFFAEVLSKRLGARCFGAPGTIGKGARAIRAWAGSLGVDIVAHDASGLSYDNRISPRQMVTLLTYGAAWPWGRVLRRALPGPGEGTLAHRLLGVRVVAKTGSLFDGSSALSGWVWMQRGRRWAAFSIMSSLGRSATALEDQVVRTLSSP